MRKMSGENSSTILIESTCCVISRMTEHDLLEVVEIEEASGLSRWGFEAYHEELTHGHNALMFVARRAGEVDSEGEILDREIAVGCACDPARACRIIAFVDHGSLALGKPAQAMS